MSASSTLQRLNFKNAKAVNRAPRSAPVSRILGIPRDPSASFREFSRMLVCVLHAHKTTIIPLAWCALCPSIWIELLTFTCLHWAVWIGGVKWTIPPQAYLEGVSGFPRFVARRKSPSARRACRVLTSTETAACRHVSVGRFIWFPSSLKQVLWSAGWQEVRWSGGEPRHWMFKSLSIWLEIKMCTFF